jgi:hypothetical protein
MSRDVDADARRNSNRSPEPNGANTHFVGIEDKDPLQILNRSKNHECRGA